MAAREEGTGLGTLLVFLSALLAVTFPFLFNDSQYRSDWGTKRSRPLADSVIKYYYTLPDVCTALARQYGLSKREEAVLQLLAQKKTAPDIATELFISIPTVKTHTQNIYRKLDIHSRTELFALLDAEVPAAHEERILETEERRPA
ncbi:response regulator transcription factor [Slackia isoflavoniconvertens]|uniref:response regulator transcription factor n=1 Tax=Slackia isoflavoniconvertens TaxID=572010 RepID=UPI003AEFAAB3